MKKFRLLFYSALIVTCFIFVFSSCKKDTTPPVINILGNNPVSPPHCVGSQYVDDGATAIDDEDGDITDKIEVTSNVNINEEGSYTVTYSVKDNAGNEAVKTRDVPVQNCK